jgi:hypothetical protein
MNQGHGVVLPFPVGGIGGFPTQAGSVTENKTVVQNKDALARFIPDVEQVASQLEDWISSPSANGLAPKTYAFVRAQARLVMAQCDYVLAALTGGLITLSIALSAAYQKRLDDVRDRLDKIIDSLSWSAEAPEELRSLALEETCV